MKIVNFPSGQTSNEDMTTAATSLHDMYAAYVKAGFTKQQAMDIILTVLRASLQVMPPPNKGA